MSPTEGSPLPPRVILLPAQLPGWPQCKCSLCAQSVHDPESEATRRLWLPGGPWVTGPASHSCWPLVWAEARFALPRASSSGRHGRTRARTAVAHSACPGRDFASPPASNAMAKCTEWRIGPGLTTFPWGCVCKDSLSLWTAPQSSLYREGRVQVTPSLAHAISGRLGCSYRGSEFSTRPDTGLLPGVHWAAPDLRTPPSHPTEAAQLGVGQVSGVLNHGDPCPSSLAIALCQAELQGWWSRPAREPGQGC